MGHPLCTENAFKAKRKQIYDSSKRDGTTRPSDDELRCANSRRLFASVPIISHILICLFFVQKYIWYMKPWALQSGLRQTLAVSKIVAKKIYDANSGLLHFAARNLCWHQYRVFARRCHSI